jgi:hypothetical protein
MSLLTELDMPWGHPFSTNISALTGLISKTSNAQPSFHIRTTKTLKFSNKTVLPHPKTVFVSTFRAYAQKMSAVRCLPSVASAKEGSMFPACARGSPDAYKKRYLPVLPDRYHFALIRFLRPTVLTVAG